MHETDPAKSKALVDEAGRFGPEPFAAPLPQPPVQPEDVPLIYGMAIESAR